MIPSSPKLNANAQELRISREAIQHGGERVWFVLIRHGTPSRGSEDGLLVAARSA